MTCTSRKTLPRDWLLAAGICSATLCCMIAFFPDLLHWFVAPVLFCGILSAADLIAWVRGRLDMFDPIGVLGILGTHFFFLAPLLQIVLEYRTLYMRDLPDDYRPWLGGMAILHAVGLLLYRKLRSNASLPPPAVRSYRLDYGRFTFMAAITLVVSVGLQIGILSRFGGVTGFVEAVSSRERLEGLGLFLIFTESCPVVAFMWISAYLAKRNQKSWLAIGLAYAFFIIFLFSFAGLRGSRSNTIYAAFWGAGIIHFNNRRLNRSIAVGGGIVICAFIYVYGFYKDFGRGALDMIESSEHWEMGTARSKRTPTLVLLGDLARSDIHALLLYRLNDESRNNTLAWGKTYLAAPLLAIPQSLWPERPAGKTKYLTDLEYGPGAYDSGFLRSSHVGGISGEGMLNFGVLGAVAGMAMLGLIMRGIQWCWICWPPGDARRMLLPFIICLGPISLMFDSDNLVFELAKQLLVPAVIVLCSSRYATPASAKPSLIGAGEQLVFTATSRK